MIVVVDYGAANLLSITRALEAVGAQVTISGAADAIEAAEGVVLPGVGAAGTSMERMRVTGADEALRRVAAAGRPILGVCLGMQLFFERIAEDDATGLGLLPGEVALLPPGRKIPQIGWNDLRFAPGALDLPLFSGITQGMFGYFVHSYYCLPADPAISLATTEYGVSICAALASGPLVGFQFHPEKSSSAGLRLLANWVRGVTGQTTLDAPPAPLEARR